MEVAFWRSLIWAGEGGGAPVGDVSAPCPPLSLRIPEVALFRGPVLELCLYTNQLGEIASRTGAEASKEALLERLLAYASRRADQADLGSQASAAIMRSRAPVVAASSSQSGGGPHDSQRGPLRAVVLSASEVINLLEGPNEGRFGFDEEWTLQSLAPPCDDARWVAIYTRDKLGEEKIEVLGRSFDSLYPLKGADYQQEERRTGDSMCGPHSVSIAVPSDRFAAIEGKMMSVVRFAQRFHRQCLQSLMAEFVVDSSEAPLLHGFWKVSTFDADSMLMPSSSVQYEQASPDNVPDPWAHLQGGARNSTHDLSIASTATLPSALDGLLMQGSMSTDTGLNASRPTSGGLSRPTSSTACRATLDTPFSSRQCSSSRPHSPMPTRLGESSVQDLQIVEDDGEGDDLEEAIERVQAASRPVPEQPASQSAPSRPLRKARQSSDARFQAGRRPVSARARLDPHNQSVLSGDGAQRRRPASARSAVRVAQGDGEGPWSAARVRRPPSAPLSSGRPSSGRPSSGRATTPRSHHVSCATAPAEKDQELASKRPVPAQSVGSVASANKTPPRVRGKVASRPSSAGRPKSGSSAAAVAAAEAAPAAATASAKAAAAAAAAPLPPSPALTMSQQAAVPKRVIHSQQLISRHTMERDVGVRILSTLSRQIERYRDMQHVWVGQRDAARCVISRAEAILVKRQATLQTVLQERAEQQVRYVQRHDALVRGLANKLDRVQQAALDRRQEVEQSVEAERDVSALLEQEEVKAQKLQQSVEQTIGTLSQLSTQRVAELGPEARDDSGTLRMSGRLSKAAGERAKAMERERLFDEFDKTKLAITRTQKELNWRRDSSAKMEEFVRQIAEGGKRYIVDKAIRKEAAALLASIARQRQAAIATAAMEVRSSTTPRKKMRKGRHEEPIAFVGRTCAACDAEVSEPEE